MAHTSRSVPLSKIRLIDLAPGGRHGTKTRHARIVFGMVLAMAVTILSGGPRARAWSRVIEGHPARHEKRDNPDCPDPAGPPPINQSETDGTRPVEGVGISC